MLNRATLARQGLLARQRRAVPEMLGHLIGLQGQVHNAPYIALWARLIDFTAADLEMLLQARQAVRAPLLRMTLHVAMAGDFLAIRPLVDIVGTRAFNSNFLKLFGDIDVEAVRAASRELLDAEALTAVGLGKRLAARWPGTSPVALSAPARFLEPIVHVPPAGLWGATGAPALTSARRWLGQNPGAPISVEALALRYLAALGPASGRDFGAWSGLAGGAEVMARLRPRLICFTGEDGRELFDLPDASRPPADAPAPVRLLPEYDNITVGHADRRRFMSAAAAAGLWRNNGMRAAFTVDGMVAGSWKLSFSAAARIELSPLGPLLSADIAALAEEGRALVAALAPGRRLDLAVAPRQ